MFLVGWVANQSTNACPKLGHAILLLVASNPLSIGSKFAASSIQHNLKPVREVCDKLGSIWRGFKRVTRAGLGVVWAVQAESKGQRLRLF